MSVAVHDSTGRAKAASGAGTDPPVGSLVPYAGSGDPPGGAWLLADGRLVSRTTYADLFAAIGHAYNGGVDPGSNQVRLPDKRGRASVGADNMGTAQGAASRLPNSNRARGQSGGEERHTNLATESGVPAHNHPPVGGDAFVVAGAPSWVVLGSGSSLTIRNPSGGTADNVTGQNGAASASAPHNNMSPYEVDSWLVRVL